MRQGRSHECFRAWVMCIRKIVMGGLFISMPIGSLRIGASPAVYSPRGQKCSISDCLLHVSLFCCLCLQFVPSGDVVASSPFHQQLAIPIIDFNCWNFIYVRHFPDDLFIYIYLVLYLLLSCSLAFWKKAWPFFNIAKPARMLLSFVWWIDT